MKATDETSPNALKLSVVIPVYNERFLVRELVERVLAVAAGVHGMSHADLVCEEGNRASAGLIEKVGGVTWDRPHAGIVRYRVLLRPREVAGR